MHVWNYRNSKFFKIFLTHVLIHIYHATLSTLKSTKVSDETDIFTVLMNV